MKWEQSIDDTDCGRTTDADKEGATKHKRTFSGKDSPCTHCLSSHLSISKVHTDATCYFLPSEAIEREQKDKDLTKAKVAHVTTKTDRDRND